MPEGTVWFLIFSAFHFISFIVPLKKDIGTSFSTLLRSVIVLQIHVSSVLIFLTQKSMGFYCTSLPYVF